MSIPFNHIDTCKYLEHQGPLYHVDCAWLVDILYPEETEEFFRKFMEEGKTPDEAGMLTKEHEQKVNHLFSTDYAGLMKPANIHEFLYDVEMILSNLPRYEGSNLTTVVLKGFGEAIGEIAIRMVFERIMDLVLLRGIEQVEETPITRQTDIVDMLDIIRKLAPTPEDGENDARWITTRVTQEITSAIHRFELYHKKDNLIIDLINRQSDGSFTPKINQQHLYQMLDHQLVMTYLDEVPEHHSLKSICICSEDLITKDHGPYLYKINYSDFASIEDLIHDIEDKDATKLVDHSSILAVEFDPDHDWSVEKLTILTFVRESTTFSAVLFN